jgi:RNA polymerase sigma factor (sigma-70 family)
MSAEVSTADLQRFRNGDASVLETLVRALGPAIEAKLCARFPMLKPYAEDLLAESLHRLWVHREEYDPAQGSLLTWWSMIARNAARDLLRTGWQRARGREAAFEAGRLEQLPEAGGSPPGEWSAEPGAAGWSEQERAFWEVFSRLPEKDRRILLYYAEFGGEGRWASSLAGELGMSAGAIRVRRLRGMARIRAELRRRGFALPAEERGA